MSFINILSLSVFLTAGMCLASILFAAALKFTMVTGMENVITFYLRKKVEAIEELEKKYGKSGPVGRASGWEA